MITDLVLAREQFGVNSDDTSVDEGARYVQMRKPDGVPDVVQQVEHGVALLLAQYHVIGHAIPGIIEPTLAEYIHLGDAASKTDGRIYSERMGPVVIIQPDFPELKEGWPFLWYENEYVVDGVTSFILAANAAHAETKSAK